MCSAHRVGVGARLQDDSDVLLVDHLQAFHLDTHRDVGVSGGQSGASQQGGAAHHSSAHVAAHKVLPADLSALVPEVDVEQHRGHARRRHQQVAEVLLVPGDVALGTTRTLLGHMTSTNQPERCKGVEEGRRNREGGWMLVFIQPKKLMKMRIPDEH